MQAIAATRMAYTKKAVVHVRRKQVCKTNLNSEGLIFHCFARCVPMHSRYFKFYQIQMVAFYILFEQTEMTTQGAKHGRVRYTVSCNLSVCLTT